jgi:tetratricopeptide (TPR) repeat protein
MALFSIKFLRSFSMCILKISLIIFLFSVFETAAQQTEGDDLFLKIAREKADYIKKVKEELPKLDELIKREPQNVDAYKLRASHYLQLEEYEKVAADYSRIIELVPNDTESYLSRAQAYYSLGLYDKSLADAETVLKIGSNNFNFYDAHLARFLVYSKREQYEKAIAALTDILKFRPEDAWAYQTRADTYRQTKQYEKAFADYTQLVKIDALSTYGYYGRAEVYKAIGEPQKEAAETKAAEEIKRKRGF